MYITACSSKKLSNKKQFGLMLRVQVQGQSINISAPSTFEELAQQLKAKFPKLSKARLAFRYQDEEGDYLTVEEDASYQDMSKIAKQKGQLSCTLDAQTENEPPQLDNDGEKDGFEQEGASIPSFQENEPPQEQNNSPSMVQSERQGKSNESYHQSNEQQNNESNEEFDEGVSLDLPRENVAQVQGGAVLEIQSGIRPEQNRAHREHAVVQQQGNRSTTITIPIQQYEELIQIKLQQASMVEVPRCSLCDSETAHRPFKFFRNFWMCNECKSSIKITFTPPS